MGGRSPSVHKSGFLFWFSYISLSIIVVIFELFKFLIVEIKSSIFHDLHERLSLTGEMIEIGS